MYYIKSFFISILISTSWAGILPKSRHPLRHGGYRTGFLLGQIELRDPMLDPDNFALRKSAPIKNKTNELFGKDGILYLTEPKVKNDLLEKVGEQVALQYLRLREPGRDGSAEGLGGLRRAGAPPEAPKLIYEFNELVV